MLFVLRCADAMANFACAQRHLDCDCGRRSIFRAEDTLRRWLESGEDLNEIRRRYRWYRVDGQETLSFWRTWGCGNCVVEGKRGRNVLAAWGMPLKKFTKEMVLVIELRMWKWSQDDCYKWKKKWYNVKFFIVFKFVFWMCMYAECDPYQSCSLSKWHHVYLSPNLKLHIKSISQMQRKACKSSPAIYYNSVAHTPQIAWQDINSIEFGHIMLADDPTSTANCFFN